MTNKEAADSYNEMAVKLARIISNVEDMRGRSEYISDEMRDNGDTYTSLSEALEKLGVALANVVIYADEYLHDTGENNG